MPAKPHDSHSPSIEFGLRENWRQFSLLGLVNAFAGGMVGLERTWCRLSAWKNSRSLDHDRRLLHRELRHLFDARRAGAAPVIGDGENSFGKAMHIRGMDAGLRARVVAGCDPYT